MSTCKECRNYFPINEEASRGDCVRRISDERQSYYTARPTTEAAKCEGCSDYLENTRTAKAH
uniref:1-methyl alkyl succinate synthase subunit MasC n=2 Tax=Azoarcus sp. HxN1 TaxID=83404 RepID=A9J4K2_9RHOO|nr:1-methyl alkyl succinate synthase subunit MasC [Azoarcus sp. HxN1]